MAGGTEAARSRRQRAATTSAVGGGRRGGQRAPDGQQAPDGLGELPLFFCFFYSINRDVQEVASISALFTLMFAQRRLVLTASVNSF